MRFADGRGTGRPACITAEVEYMVLEAVHLQEFHGGELSQVPIVSQSSVWRILHHNLLCPYQLQLVQCLRYLDFVPRVTFCQWVQQQAVVSPRFARNILFPDEAGFTRDGIFNYIPVIHIFDVK